MDSLLDQEPAFFAFPADAAFDFDMMQTDAQGPLNSEMYCQDHVSTSDEYLDSLQASPQRSDSSAPSPSFVPLVEDILADESDPFSASFPTDPLAVTEDVVMGEIKAEPLTPDQNLPSPISEPMELQDEQRGRKRKAPASPNVKASRVKLEQGRVVTKDEMASMSAEELEEYAQQLEGANLTTSEKNEIRRHLRLIKNRESAQASRLRKKSYIEELERKVNALQTENSRLRDGISSLNTENVQLKTRVDVLHKFVSTTGVGKILANGAAFLSKLAPKPLTPSPSPATPTTQAGPSHGLNHRQTGMILMVMLFSFGLLFNSQLGLGQDKQLALPSTALTTTGRVLEHPQFVPTSEGRKLQELYEKQEMPTQRIIQRIQAQSDMPDPASHSIRLDESTVKAHVPAVQPVIAEWKANTTYLLCPEVQRLTPPMEVAEDPSVPVQVAFLIPPDALGGSSRGERPREYLEVTCQVLSVASRPMQRGPSIVDVHA